MMPIPETCFNKLDKLIDVKKTSEIEAEKMTNAIKIKIVLYWIKKEKSPPPLAIFD